MSIFDEPKIDCHQHVFDPALSQLGMLVDVQVETAQLPAMLPLLKGSDVPILIDHCGRPAPEQGIDQPGFQALLQPAGTGRVAELRGAQWRTRTAGQTLIEHLVPDPTDRRRLLWDTPARLSGIVAD